MAGKRGQRGDLLDRWDEAERRLDESEPHSDEWTEAVNDMTALSREWRAHRSEGRPDERAGGSG